jgi:hypothetical protein
MSITLRASHPGDYEGGIYIEAGLHANGCDEWACYDWTERGLAEIDGPFTTRETALTVLRNEGEYLEARGYSAIRELKQ